MSAARFITTLLRALRAAALLPAGAPLPAPGGTAAARSVCAPQTAAPGVATPGAATPCNHSETQDMQTLPQRVVAVPFRARQHVTPARGRALKRWHARARLVDVIGALQANPRFPLIAGGAP